MTQRILTTTALVGAALALSVPAAWGSEPYRDHGDATDAKLALQSQLAEVVRDHGDAAQAKLAIQPALLEIVRDHGDATQAKLVVEPAPLAIVRDHGDATAAKLALQSSPEVFPAEQPSTATGREIEWSQLAIGVLIGTVFAFGLILAVRFTRSRPLAH
ncbi:MAG: hypothetical protein HW413_2479 [Thermoleophilia bacterium]|nr:hypothetical protein [Thermoleophilia bacterium]